MRAQTRAGFSLVEVLVSILILSIGVIGAASMQLVALRNTQESRFHSTGLYIATEIADQIRALAAAGLSDSGNLFVGLDFKGGADVPIAAESCFEARTGCDLMMLNVLQLQEIESRAQTMLPQGRIKVCRDHAPWDSANNAYTWECKSGAGNAPIVVKIGWHERAEGAPAASSASAGPRIVIPVQA